MPDLSYWASFFYRAAKEEIGATITFDAEVTGDIINNNILPARPKGFEDYSVAMGQLPNTIFIVKPGVTLD